MSSILSCLQAALNALSPLHRDGLQPRVAEIYHAIKELSFRVDRPESLFSFLQLYPLVIDIDVPVIHWLDTSSFSRYSDPLRTSCLSIVRYKNQTYCMPWPVKLLVVCQVLSHLQHNVPSSSWTVAGQSLLDLVYRCRISIGPHSVYPYSLPYFAQSTSYQSVHAIAKLWSPVLHYFRLRGHARQRTLTERRALYHDDAFWRGVTHVVRALLFITIISDTDTPRDTTAWKLWMSHVDNNATDSTSECMKQVDSVLNENDHAYGPWRDKYCPRGTHSVLNLTDLLYAPIHCLRRADIRLPEFTIHASMTPSSPHGEEPFARMDIWPIRVITAQEAFYHEALTIPPSMGSIYTSILIDTRGHQTTATDIHRWTQQQDNNGIDVLDVPSIGAVLVRAVIPAIIVKPHAISLAIFLHQQIDGHGAEYREYVIDFFRILNTVHFTIDLISQTIYAFIYGHPPLAINDESNKLLFSKIARLFWLDAINNTWSLHNKQLHGSRYAMALCALLFPYIDVDVSDQTYTKWSQRLPADPSQINACQVPLRVDPTRSELIRNVVQFNMTPGPGFLSTLSLLRFYVPLHMQLFLNCLQGPDNTTPFAPQRGILNQILHLIAPVPTAVASVHEYSLESTTYLCGPRTNPHQTLLPLARSILLGQQESKWPTRIPPLIHTFRNRWKTELEKEEGIHSRKRSRGVSFSIGKADANADDSPLYRPPPTPPEQDDEETNGEEHSPNYSPTSPSYSPTSPVYNPDNDNYSPHN